MDMPTLAGLWLIRLQQYVNEILRLNMEANYDEADLWLADTYETLPDFQGPHFIGSTRPTVDASWQSPFKGQSLAEVAAWVRDILKPPKSVCKRFSAVAQRDLCAQQGKVLVCKIIKDQNEAQTIPIDARWLSTWVNGYKRDRWEDDWKKQSLYR